MNGRLAKQFRRAFPTNRREYQAIKKAYKTSSHEKKQETLAVLRKFKGKTIHRLEIKHVGK